MLRSRLAQYSRIEHRHSVNIIEFFCWRVKQNFEHQRPCMQKKMGVTKLKMVKKMRAYLWNLDKPSRSMYSSGSLIKLLGCVGKSIRLSFRSSSEFKASAGLIALLIKIT